MKVARGIDQLGGGPKHPVVAIGNFDGVHRGHQAIIAVAREQARERGGECVAYTFRPHPQLALHPATSPALLTTYDEKLELLARQGVGLTVEEPFSREFSTIEASKFFHDILLHRLGAEAIVVGYDFAFGRERQGGLERLREFCRASGVQLTVVPALRIEGELVSSTRIRQQLREGEIPRANRLLGREFAYRGVVIRGEGRGRKIGFPTANLRLPDSDAKLALPYGVYATRVVFENGDIRSSVTNVGVRPTFRVGGADELTALIETHLLDFDADLYGRAMEVRFVHRIREERKFSGIDELRARIAEDAREASVRLSQG